MAKTGSTVIQWTDYEGCFCLQTDSQKLVETLCAVGIRWTHREGGVWYYKLPTAWLRLRVPNKGLVKLGWYPTAKQKGVLVLMEDRPKLEVIKNV